MAFVAAQGLNYDGGHDETHGLTPAGEIIEVPLHRHEVSMDLTELQLSVQHAFTDRWIGTLRIPFSSRRQDTEVVPVDPATPAELTAMENNGYIHHRDETFRGVGDPRLSVGLQGVPGLREGDGFFAALGFTVPLGETEADPWKAGAAGEKHTHPQLGTGTVDPVMELRYGLPLQARLALLSGLQVRWPVYENRKTYRGPLDLRGEVSAVGRIHGPFTGLLGYDLLVQGYSHWNGLRDPNSGIVSHSVRFGLGGAFRGTGFQLSAFVPVGQDLLQGGDAFELGPTIVLSVSRAWTQEGDSHGQ